MDTAKQAFTGPIRLGPVWYVVLGLCTGPGFYAYRTGNTLALVAFAALCALWYVAGQTGLTLIRHRIALALVVDHLEQMRRTMLAPPASSARLSPPADKAAP